MGRYNYGWKPYVSVAERKAKAAQHMEKERKKGKTQNPIVTEGRLIAKTFWGKAWCENLEAYSDYESRLPRGRTYVRNGSIIDFQIEKGRVLAKVMGSSLYSVEITISRMEQLRWEKLSASCTGKINSLFELLQGKFSTSVMEILTDKKLGLFPEPKEIRMKCSCPDFASMCKHVAAVLYGVSASLDHHPEWLFTLRHVDHLDLIASAEIASHALESQEQSNALTEDLSALFGIEIDAGGSPPIQPAAEPKIRKARKSVVTKAVAVPEAPKARKSRKQTASSQTPPLPPLEEPKIRNSKKLATSNETLPLPLVVVPKVRKSKQQ